MPAYKEESPSEGDDPRATNDRRMFYYSAAGEFTRIHYSTSSDAGNNLSAPARDVQTYQTSWVSSPDLIALKLQYLPIYKVFRCTFCITACNRNSPKGCIHPANLAKHLRNFHDLDTIWRKSNNKLTQSSRTIPHMKACILLSPLSQMASSLQRSLV